MTEKWYVVEIDSVEGDFENVDGLVEQGTPVVIFDDMEQLTELFGKDIEIVEV